MSYFERKTQSFRSITASLVNMKGKNMFKHDNSICVISKHDISICDSIVHISKANYSANVCRYCFYVCGSFFWLNNYI